MTETAVVPLLSNRLYDTLKFLSTILLPALGTFYAAVAILWGWPYAEQVVGTVAALSLLLGALIKKSSDSFQQAEHNAAEASRVGTIMVAEDEEGDKTLSFKIVGDPYLLDTYQSVTFDVERVD